MTEIDESARAKRLKDGLVLAGFALGQAAWSLEDGPGLVPIGLSRVDGQISMQRFVVEITDGALPDLWKIVASKAQGQEFGALAFESSHPTGTGQTLDVINVHVINHLGHLTGTIAQAFRPAQRSRVPGRSRPFTVVGTPAHSDEIDRPGVREAIMLGVMTHPEGSRLFAELRSMTRQLIAGMEDDPT